MNCPRCNTPINEHPPNPCINAVFAELVMGLKVFELNGMYFTHSEKLYNTDFRWRLPIKKYSTNIADAMEGVEKNKEKIKIHISWCGEVWSIQVWEKRTSSDWIGIYDKNLALVITRALILWKLARER